MKAEKEKYKKGGLLLSENTLLLFDRLTDEEAVTFIRIIRNYHRDGTLPPPQTERLVSISFDLFKLDYDNSQRKYREKVERMLKNRQNPDVSQTSQDVSQTSQDVSRNTTQDITTQDITTQDITFIKEKEEKKDVSSSISLSADEEKFSKWMVEKFPNLSEMEKPLTLKQYNDFQAEGYTIEQINEKLNAMENEKSVPCKKRSCYYVLKKWLENG